MMNEALSFINKYAFVFAQFTVINFAASKIFDFAREARHRFIYLSMNTVLLFALIQIKINDEIKADAGIEFFNFLKLFAIIAFTFFLWRLQFENKSGELGFFTILFYYEMMLSDLFLGNVAVVLLQNNVLAIFKSSAISQFIISLLSIICFATLACATLHYFKNKELRIPTKYWIVVNVILLFCFGISLLFMNYNASISSQKSSLSALFVWLGFATISFFVVKLFTDLCFYFQVEKRALIEQISLKSMQRQLEIQEQAMLDVQKIRHDMKNNLNYLNILFIEKKDKEGLNYLNQLNTQIEASPKAAFCPNHTINSMLNYKNSECEKRKIHLKISVDPTFETAVEAIDLTNALSNLLDNAIECVELFEPEKRHIEICISKYQQYDCFMVLNAYTKELKISHGNYMTSKSNTLLHGYGLKSIKSIADKYFGTFQIDTKNHQFKATLLLYAATEL